MDTQTKLKVSIATHNNGYVIRNEEYIIDINDEIYPDGFLGNEVISFNEYNQVSLSVHSNDLNTVMEIETYTSEDAVTVKPEETIIITSGIDQDDILVPGYYPIVIRTPKKVYYGMFKVTTSSISWDGLMNIRKYLEDIMSGLAHDLHQKKTGKQYKEFSEVNNHVYHLINENYQELIHCIDTIINNPINDIYKAYQERSYSSHADRKSQKWLDKKGVMVNTNPYNPAITYEKHSTLTNDTLENKWIKKIICYIGKSIRELEQNYFETYEDLELRIANKHLEFNVVVNEYQEVSNNLYISTVYKNSLYNRKEVIYSNLLELKTQLNYIAEIISSIKKIKGSFSHYEHETWLEDILGHDSVKKPSLKMLKDTRYLKTYNIYRKLWLMKNNQLDNTNNSYPFKKTSKLFEYYILMIVIKIIQEKGFEWVSGWMADNIDLSVFNGEIPIGTILTFNNKEYSIEIAYDTEIQREPNSMESSQFVAINSRHCRPDIRISIFENGEFKDAAIVEVKCRKQTYIYNEKGDTPVVEQLRDYYNFGYYDAEKRKVSRNVINKVIVTYPKQGEEITSKDRFFNFSFIQVEPTEGDIPYGYGEIKREIEEFLCL